MSISMHMVVVLILQCILKLKPD